MAKVLWYLGHEICFFGGSSLNLCTLEEGTHTPPFPQIQASLPSYTIHPPIIIIFYVLCKARGRGLYGNKGPTQGGSECGLNSPKKSMHPNPPPPRALHHCVRGTY
jgi:hypothetical protein